MARSTISTTCGVTVTGAGAGFASAVGGADDSVGVGAADGRTLGVTSTTGDVASGAGLVAAGTAAGVGAVCPTAPTPGCSVPGGLDSAAGPPVSAARRSATAYPAVIANMAVKDSPVVTILALAADDGRRDRLVRSRLDLAAVRAAASDARLAVSDSDPVLSARRGADARRR